MNPKLTLFLKKCTWCEQIVSFHSWERTQWIAQMLHQVAEKSRRCVFQLFCCSLGASAEERHQGKTKILELFALTMSVQRAYLEEKSDLLSTLQLQTSYLQRTRKPKVNFCLITPMSYYFLLKSFGNFPTFNSLRNYNFLFSFPFLFLFLFSRSRAENPSNVSHPEHQQLQLEELHHRK